VNVRPAVTRRSVHAFQCSLFELRKVFRKASATRAIVSPTVFKHPEGTSLTAVSGRLNGLTD
jgi:hypothetical protein